MIDFDNIDRYKPEIADIILKDSDHTGAKVVKFLMRSPTVWHDIFRTITKTQEKVEYYHVSMMINNGFYTTGIAQTIEQQKKVQLNDWNPNNRQIIFRKTNLTKEDKEDLKQEAFSDLGQGYDILNCFGKALTWITGIKWFARHVESPKREICVNRIALWMKNVLGEKFGVRFHSELTTYMLYKYLCDGELSEDYHVVYKKETENG